MDSFKMFCDGIPGSVQVFPIFSGIISLILIIFGSSCDSIGMWISLIDRCTFLHVDNDLNKTTVMLCNYQKSLDDLLARKTNEAESFHLILNWALN